MILSGSEVSQMKILLTIDGSDFSQAALQSVIARPWPANSKAKVLNVVEPLPF